MSTEIDSVVRAIADKCADDWADGDAAFLASYIDDAIKAAIVHPTIRAAILREECEKMGVVIVEVKGAQSLGALNRHTAAGFALTAALTRLPEQTVKGRQVDDAEVISRARVMDLIHEWRRAIDTPLPPTGDDNGK